MANFYFLNGISFAAGKFSNGGAQKKGGLTDLPFTLLSYTYKAVHITYQRRV